MSENKKAIVINFVINSNINLSKLLPDLKALGCNIVKTYTNNPYARNMAGSYVEYVENRDGYIGDIIALHQVDGSCYWIEKGNIENNHITIIPTNLFLHPQLQENLKGVIDDVKLSSIGVSSNLSEIYGKVDYILYPRMSDKELRNSIIDAISEIKYKFR